MNDGLGNFEKIFLGNHPGAISIEASDMNNDGIIDIVGGSYADNQISIFFHDGNLNFSETNIFTGGDVFDINITDLNNDGYKDIVASEKESQNLSWYKNLGNGDFENQTIINDYKLYIKYYSITKNNISYFMSNFYKHLNWACYQLKYSNYQNLFNIVCELKYSIENLLNINVNSES